MRLVIVGAGFAGIKLARELEHDGRFDITLISDRDHFEYHAALYRSATGRSHLEVMVPLGDIFPLGSRIDIVRDRVSSIDATHQLVVGSSGRSYKYDKLVMAVGVVTEYYGIHGLADYSYGMKSIDEAQRLKDHLHAELSAGKTPDVNYVIVGAGPTGVELAGELVAYLATIRKAHRLGHKKFTVHLVEAAPRVLPTLPEDVSAKVTQRLKRLGVMVRAGMAVQQETKDRLMLPGGETIMTHLVVWTAGVAGNPVFATSPAFKLGKGRRVVVDETLMAAPNIYVLGDAASTALSGWGQTALYDAQFLASVLRAQNDHGSNNSTQPSYHPRRPVAAIPVGPRWCAVAHGNKRLYGYAGWLIRRQLDRTLFHRLLPKKLADRAWLRGALREETCPVCAKRMGFSA